MPPPQGIRISVVVPAFNEESYLGATLTSLQQQDFGRPYEIIVVDNNSTDGTAALAATFGVTVLHESRPGVCAARQRGTAEARGSIVVSTDADTVHPPDWLSRIDAAFLDSDDVALVAGPCRYLSPSWWTALYPRLLFGSVSQTFRRTGRLFYITATNTAFLRASFPGYSLSMTQGGDELDLLRRMRGRGRSVWLHDNVVSTSPRRLARGVLHALVVSLLIHYLLAYAVNRLTARVVLGTAPSVRTQHVAAGGHRSPARDLAIVVLILTLAAALVLHQAG